MYKYIQRARLTREARLREYIVHWETVPSSVFDASQVEVRCSSSVQPTSAMLDGDIEPYQLGLLLVLTRT